MGRVNGVRRRAIVTGAAGFIGSHLSERLVADGWHVTGIDSFTDYYPRMDKESNLASLSRESAFDLVECDLSVDGWQRALAGSTAVFHLAAQAGVRGSFGESFVRYARDNMVATQRVFEGANTHGVRRVVWASSSSVYGDAESHPCREGVTPTLPRSPYGVTKRACEDLAQVYRKAGLAISGLRYFTVYGPRQRPDMAIRRICDALVTGESFAVYGDGFQSRDFTYVTDAVDATVRAALAENPAPVYNVGGGDEATLSRIIALLESLAGCRLTQERRPAQHGDVRRTSADVRLATNSLGWAPEVSLPEGLAAQLSWVRGHVLAEEVA